MKKTGPDRGQAAKNPAAIDEKLEITHQRTESPGCRFDLRIEVVQEAPRDKDPPPPTLIANTYWEWPCGCPRIIHDIIHQLRPVSGRS